MAGMYPPTSSQPPAQASTNYREAFQLYDKRGKGRVVRENLGNLLRACGQNPTLAEIADLERNVGTDFDFETFSKILNRPGGFREPMDIDDYTKAFRLFDKENTGFIGRGQVKYVLMNMGEKMSESEVEDLFRAADVHNDEVNYNDLVTTIWNN
ncbi:EF-hand [Mytilinidion resinicola]|uniref:Calmodulin n=1 Tax=Mytilinidion resinicola TaxID=574789 RepID=A0A6A6Y9C5_9PEZI|nr:EF-hand [Mytilinidion resinicola]KAF2805421.1 EF-hand [Mytilinidion resinicola]